jgi:hypothetical protein
MRSTGARIALVVVAVAVAVAAFVVLSSSGDGDEETVATAPGEAPAGDQGGGGGAGSGRPGAERGGQAVPPDATTIEVEGGAPVGGVADIEVQRGDRVRLVVRSDVAEEVHVHGYDLFADVAPGRPAELRFTADVEGVYEVELEQSHTEIAGLTVEP